MSGRRAGLFVLLLLIGQTALWAQTNNAKDKKAGGPNNSAADHQLVERVLAARKEYQESLEALRAHYIAAGEIERARWAEDELLQYHRISKFAYRLELDVPPPN